MVALVEEAMSKQPAAPGFLLDGFPANLAQARLCRERLGDPVKVILLEVPDHVMMSRYRPSASFHINTSICIFGWVCSFG